MAETTLRQKKPHFFKPILHCSLQTMSIPKAFVRDYLVGGKRRGKAQLKTERGETVKSWTVSIKGGSFIDGWKEFAAQNDLCVGDILVFKHEGGLIFHVLIFDSTACERKYPKAKTINAHQREDKELIAAKDSPSPKGGTTLKQNANPPKFTITMKSYNFSWKALCIPAKFGRENGLAVAPKIGIVTLKDTSGKSWEANLRWNQSSNVAYIGGGWSAFSAANKLKVGDECTFKLVSRWSNEFVMEVSVHRCKTTSSA